MIKKLENLRCVISYQSSARTTRAIANGACQRSQRIAQRVEEGVLGH